MTPVSTGPHCGPIHGRLYGPPPNGIKNKNKDFTAAGNNRSLVSAKFRALRWENVIDLNSVSGACYIIAHAFPFAMANNKRPRDL